MRKLVVLFVLFAACQSKKPQIIFDVSSLIGGSPNEIINVLGNPDSTYNKTILNKPYYYQQYDERDMQVRYLNDEIVDIIINKPYDLEFTPETIEKFGFRLTPPDKMDTAANIMWMDKEGLRYINLYKVGSKKPDSVTTNFKIYFNISNK